MKKTNSGFTLIEVTVSVSIAVLITAIVLFGYSRFNDNVSLTTAGQEILVAIRQAQVYGLSVREAGIGTGQFNSAYGIAFSTTDSSAYHLFVDTNGNHVYDVGNGCGSVYTECVERVSLRNGVVISNICDASSCPPNGTVVSLQATFLRPNTDAILYFGNAGGAIWGGRQPVGKAVLRSVQGKTLTVTIESTGQISL